MGYCSSAPASLTPPRETKGWAGCACNAASSENVSEALSTGLSLAETRPASIAARARARLSNKPRSTSRRSMRLRGEAMLSGSEPRRRQGDANLERGQVVPDVDGLFARQHQRCAMKIERVDHHEIVVLSEIFNGQPVGIDQAAGPCRDFRGTPHTIDIERGVVGIAQTKFPARGHVAEFVHGAAVGAGSAERRKVGDDGICLIHHDLVGLEYAQRSVSSRAINDIVERVKPGQAMAAADFSFLPADFQRIRQEHIGTCQINVHGHSVFNRSENRFAFKKTRQNRDAFSSEVRTGSRLTPQNRGVAAQASFTVSVLTSLPRVSNTLATMPLASSPARAYIAFGESWSRNSSGRTMERIRKPPSSMPCSARVCMTCEPNPPIEPSSMVRRISCSRASLRISSRSSGFMKRASAMVVESPWAASSSAAFSHSPRRVPKDNSAILLPWRTMRPLPISSGMPTSGISMPRPSPRG